MCSSFAMSPTERPSSSSLRISASRADSLALVQIPLTLAATKALIKALSTGQRVTAISELLMVRALTTSKHAFPFICLDTTVVTASGPSPFANTGQLRHSASPQKASQHCRPIGLGLPRSAGPHAFRTLPKVAASADTTYATPVARTGAASVPLKATIVNTWAERPVASAAVVTRRMVAGTKRPFAASQVVSKTNSWPGLPTSRFRRTSARHSGANNASPSRPRKSWRLRWSATIMAELATATRPSSPMIAAGRLSRSSDNARSELPSATSASSGSPLFATIPKWP